LIQGFIERAGDEQTEFQSGVVPAGFDQADSLPGDAYGFG
jgi:hypothetical protein